MNIIVPTDFSKCAKAAFQTACDLATPLNAIIHLFHAANIPEDWEKLPSLEKYRDNLNQEIVGEANHLLKILQAEAQSSGITCHLHYAGGDLLSNLEEMIEVLEIDLVIMGSFGISGSKDWLWGSNTQKVVRKVLKDVLVVKDHPAAVEISKVVFASDLDAQDREVFKYFLDFIAPLSIEKVYILAVNTPGFFSQPTVIMREALDDFKNLVADKYDCEAHFYDDISVDQGIREFSNVHDIDLIAIANRQRNPISRIFMGSHVEALVSHAERLVLSINY